MGVILRSKIEIEAKRNDVFREAVLTLKNLPLFFVGYKGIIPGVAEAHVVGGGPLQAGSLREVKLTDGSVIQELLLNVDFPGRHHYNMAKMNRLQRLVCKNMESDWRFYEDRGKTRIDWTYRIQTGNLFQRLAVWIMAPFMKKAMDRCLQNVRNYVLEHDLIDQMRKVESERRT